MGLKKPSIKFRLPDLITGIALEAYYGGRSEVRIRDTALPEVLVDYTSNYSASAALLKTWDLEIARKLRVKDITEEARKTLESVTLKTVREPKFWARLNFMAKVVPDGQLLPGRTVFADDPGGENTKYWFEPSVFKVGNMVHRPRPRKCRSKQPSYQHRQSDSSRSNRHSGRNSQ